MKKLMQVFASVMIATSTFGGVTSVAAKENTPAYKIEYQNADSMQSVFTKELHKKYANVKFKKKTTEFIDNSRPYYKHELISNNSDDIDEFQERVIKLKKYGVNINYEKEYTSDGATPLDVFIGKYFNYDDCKDIKSGFTISANTVKRCENKKAKYRVLKQNGAVCKTNCEYEKYFR